MRQVPMYSISGKGFFKDSFQVYVHTCKELGPKTRIHAHDFIEIAYVMTGSGTHHLGNSKYEVLIGDLFVINSSQSHYYTKTNNLEICYLIIGPRFLKRKLRYLKNIPGFCEFFYVEPIFRKETGFSQHLHLEGDSSSRISDILGKVRTELENRSGGYKVLVESLLMEFFIEVSRLYYGFCQKNIGTEQIDSKKRAVEEVINFVEHNYGEDIRLADLARCGCLQSEYLCRVFKRLTGMTMIEYLTGIRIQKACEMLSHTSDSVTEICFRVGFHDSSYFTRAFNKATGMSPSEFRKKSK